MLLKQQHVTLMLNGFNLFSYGLIFFCEAFREFHGFLNKCKVDEAGVGLHLIL